MALRNSIKQARTNTSIAYRSASSSQICARIRMLEHYQKAQKIGLYYAVQGEIDLTNLWETATSQGKWCYFPALKDPLELNFFPATPATPFKKNRYAIPEPDVSKDLALPIEELDLIILPLVAFDMRCTRLGMGAGYYDRTLEKKTAWPSLWCSLSIPAGRFYCS